MDTNTNTAETPAENVINGQPVKALPDHVEITLSSGKIARIERGRGEHCEKAEELATIGDEKNPQFDKKAYTRWMMCLLVTIDGKTLMPEDLIKMDMKDYLTLKGKFSEINFT